MLKDKNIKLGYLLGALHNTFFWYAPWLLYMLIYANFTQVAIVQAVGMITCVIVEVPTGAISDLLGKKRTLRLSFLLTSIGEILMIFNPSFTGFIIAYIVLNIGYSFYTGTMDAFLYDTLVSEKREKEYPKILSRSGAITDAVLAIASIIGGFMYRWLIILPFLATGIMKFLGFLLTFIIDEPEVDTDTFSFRNFILQTKKGFTHLFSKKMFHLTLLLLTFGAFYTVAWELLDDVTIIAFGYREIEMGFLYGILIFLAVPFNLLYERLSKKCKPYSLFVGGIFVIILNFIFTPWINVYIWTGLFLMRVIYSPIRNNAMTEILNKNTSSKIRATTISTKELLRRIPFVLFSGLIGGLIDAYGAKTFAFYFALVFLIVVSPQILYHLATKSNQK